MNEIQKKFIESPGRYLMHYNHNHDRLGRFARSNGVASNSKYTRSDKKAAIRQYEYDHPKNKGMSPIDHIYDYILKRDAIKRDKDWKKNPPEHLDISEYKKTDNFVQDFKNIDFGPNASSENIKAYQTLQGAIIDKSVDWYNSIPKTERTKKTYADLESGKIDNAHTSIQYTMPDNIKKKRGLKGDWSYRLTPFENKLLGDVLEDLGYKNTKEARIALYESGALFWD